MNAPNNTLVLHPYFKTGDVNLRNSASELEEACGLARAIDLPVAESLVVPLAKVTPATFVGTGKVMEIAALIEEKEIKLVIFNASLSPVQQRNLEKEWNCKVIDRTALILEIFGARARTAEGKLQVELAALDYQKGRLVRSWTHLERQRGGFGFLGGPGESQIEIDRRLIRDRMSKLKKELETVTRTRELHRKKRRDVPYPIVALVGYTNAGKSTLFNRLTGADVLSMDKLFATLDPTMRALKLPGGTTVILSDTVGFVSRLPTELIAAFRATLEEVLEADILLHVRDVAHEDTNAQKQDVESVLKRLFKSDALPENVIEVLNKSDLLDDGGQMTEDKQVEDDLSSAIRHPSALRVSALTGEGIPALLAEIEKQVAERFLEEAEFTIPAADGKSLAWLHAHGQVVTQTLQDEEIHVLVRMPPENLARFKRL